METNTLAVTMTPAAPSDRVGTYAQKVLEVLKAEASSETPQALTAPEIAERMGLSERPVREGIDRLLLFREITAAKRHTVGKRGASPLVYCLTTPPNQ